MTEVQTSGSRPRITWIDAAKGLGILLIVLGHITSVSDPSQLYVYLYAFHVPLFFFVSGLTLKPGRVTFAAMVKDKFRALLVPYFFWALVGYAFYLSGYFVAARLGLKIEQFSYGVWTPLIGVLYGSLGDGHLVNTPVWFIVALFCAYVLAWLINTHLQSNWLKTIAVLLIAMMGYQASRWVKLPWSLGSAMVGLVFLQGGVWYASVQQSDTPKNRLWVAFVITLGLSFLALENGFVTLADVVLGNPVLYLVHGAIGLLMVVYLCRALGSSAGWLARLGRYSMSIMVTHMLIIKSVKVLLAMITHQPISAIEADWLLSGVVLLGTLVALVPTVYIVERFLPVTLGKASSGTNRREKDVFA